MLLRSAVGHGGAAGHGARAGCGRTRRRRTRRVRRRPRAAGRRARPHQLLLVDDAQHLDPQAALLVRVLAAGAELTVIAGDPNQSVFGYRGADPALLRETGADRLVLTQSHRCAPAVARAVAGIARRLPGADAARDITAAPTTGRVGGGADRGDRARRVRHHRRRAAARAPGRRRAVVADGGHRAVGAAGGRGAGPRADRRGRAGGAAVGGAPLAEQPAVPALLTVLDADADGLTVTGAGVADRADRPRRPGVAAPVASYAAPRRRQPAAARVRRPAGRGAGAGPPDSRPHLARPVRRVRAVLAAARRSAARRPGSAHHAVAGLAPLRSAAAVAGRRRARRSAGAQAGRDLDAVTALFDVAEQYVTRTAGASLRGLVDHVAALTLPAAPRATPGDRSGGGAQRALRARAANGSSWSSPDCRKGCGPTPFRAAACSAPSSWSTSSTASRREDGLVDQRAAAGRGAQAADGCHGPGAQHLLVTAVDSDSGDDGDAAVAVLRRARRAGHRAPEADAAPDAGTARAGPRRAGRPAARGGVRTRRGG